MTKTLAISISVVSALMIFGFMSLPGAYSYGSSNFGGCGIANNSEYSISSEKENAVKLIHQNSDSKNLNLDVSDEPFLLWLVENNCGNIVDVWKIKISDQTIHDNSK